jgi:hypothetical protein
VRRPTIVLQSIENRTIGLIQLILRFHFFYLRFLARILRKYRVSGAIMQRNFCER